MKQSASPNKKPRGRCGGANFSFLSKEVTADSVLGYRSIIFLDLDLFVVLVLVLLASKSLVLLLVRSRVQLHFAWAQ